MTDYVATLLRAADQLAAGRGQNYRERLQLERAVFRLTSAHTISAFGWTLNSMSPSAHDELLEHCENLGVGLDHQTLVLVNNGFAIMRMIAAIANADPYILNENISRIIHRYSTGVAILPSALREFAAACSQRAKAGEPD